MTNEERNEANEFAAALNFVDTQLAEWARGKIEHYGWRKKELKQALADAMEASGRK